MEVVSVKLMYLCRVLPRLSKHFLLSLSMSLDLPESECEAQKYNTSIIFSCMGHSFQNHTKIRDCSFKPSKAISLSQLVQ